MIQPAFTSAMKANRFPRELCMQPIAWDAKRLAARNAIELKYDGFRVIGPVGELTTREGVPVACVSHLIGQLHTLCASLFGLQTVLDMEYVDVIDGVNGALSDFRRGKGDGILAVFDAIPLDVWLGRTELEPLFMRRRRLETAFATRPKDKKGLVLAEHRIVTATDVEEAIELAAGSIWEDGLEGLVVKDLDSPYVRASSPAWMKLKRVETIDATVTGAHAEGGRLKCLRVWIGGRDHDVVRGFSEAERLIPVSQWLRQVVELKHYGEAGKGGFKSLTYLRRREDKMKGRRP